MALSGRGRFDRSFVIRMIRDFFFALVAVTLIEMAVRLGLVYYAFETKDRQVTEAAAEQLASDLKDIMLNQGGPVAARTIFPTWQRIYQELGLEIALIPSPVTMASISKTVGFTPKGIPPAWSEGRHHEVVRTLQAEPFCISCHIDAQPGDALGTVVVRNYRAAHMKTWWAEVNVLSLIWMVNIIANTLVLFVLLRVRMEPLLGLRALVAALAKGKLDLTYRAQVKSEDEFGELAADLNHFLDRIAHVTEDLDHVLLRMVAAKHRLDQVSTQMTEHFDAIHVETQRALQWTFRLQEERTLLAGKITETVELIDLLLAMLPGGAVQASFRDRAEDILHRLQGFLRQAQESDEAPRSAEALMALSEHVHALSHFLESMSLLQERMEVIAENGQTLLARLARTTPDADLSHAPGEPAIPARRGAG